MMTKPIFMTVKSVETEAKFLSKMVKFLATVENFNTSMAKYDALMANSFTMIAPLVFFVPASFFCTILNFLGAFRPFD